MKITIGNPKTLPKNEYIAKKYLIPPFCNDKSLFLDQNLSTLYRNFDNFKSNSRALKVNVSILYSQYNGKIICFTLLLKMWVFLTTMGGGRQVKANPGDVILDVPLLPSGNWFVSRSVCKKNLSLIQMLFLMSRRRLSLRKPWLCICK